MQLEDVLDVEITNLVNRTWNYTSSNGSTFMSFTLSFSLQATPNTTVENIQNILQANERSILPIDHTLTNEAFEVLLFQPECK